MGSVIEERLEKLRIGLAEKGLDTFLVMVAENRRYLSGFTGEDGQFDETAGVLFVTASAAILLTDSRYELQASREAPLFGIRCHQKGWVEAASGILRELDTRRLGFESARISHAQYLELREGIDRREGSVELVPVENLVERQRLVKSAGEIEATREALRIAEAVFREVVAGLKAGMREMEIAWAMEKGMRESGAESLSFPVIVASGANSALPHAVPGERAVRTGEPILFDWGARLHGYCSDTSRTLVLGDPDDRFLEVHRIVLEAQQAAIAAIKSGVSSRSVDALARGIIDRAGFGGRFGHGLGHGTGLAIHEGPRLSPIRDTILEPGMVVTVEPGIYLPDWGGVRIENQVVVREHGAEVLNTLPVSHAVTEYQRAFPCRI